MVSTTKMADFADSSAVAVDVELLAPIAAGRLSPALPAGAQLLDTNLYARLQARRRPRGPRVECDLLCGAG